MSEELANQPKHDDLGQETEESKERRSQAEKKMIDSKRLESSTAE
jgi:hypothetical protein